MATIRTTYKFKCDLDKGTLETTLRNSLMQADALADAFAVTVQRNGADVDISGMTVYGYLYANATKTTVPLKGTVSGSTATVILSEDCYAVPGYASLMIQLHDGDVRHTVLKVDFAVTRTGGTLVLDGDNILPTLAELLGQIAAMEQATAEAREATNAANHAAENVEAFKGEIQGNITALTQEIGNTNNTLGKVIDDTMVVEIGKNRCPDNFFDGYLESDGSLVVSNDWKTTDYIYVGDCGNVVLSLYTPAGKGNYGTVMYFLTTYNENKERVGYYPTDYVSIYTVESGVAYIRFAYHSEQFIKLQVESGTTPTPYEPYTMAYKIKDKFVWSGKKWACVGDSLTEHNNRTTMNYHDYIADKTGITVVNMGRSGTGYARTQDEGYAFYQRIVDVPTDADVVTIFGSGNDMGADLELGNPTDTGTETLCGCINATIDDLIAIMPAVSLGIVSPTPWINYPPHNANNAMAQYCNALKTICEYRSIPYLDLYHCSNLRPWTAEGRAACYTKDDGNGVHPDETGHKLIASRFKAFLETLIM